MQRTSSSRTYEQGVLALTIRIVTDSTASIPSEICRALGITVVSATIHFGSDTFIDGVDPASRFYDRLQLSDKPPTTSTPSPGAFLEAYRRLAAEEKEIISIHVMESKSSLIQAARVAASMLPDIKIHIIDSQSTSLGLGLLTMVAAQAAQLGESAQSIVERVERLIPRVNVHACIRELTQLRRSGRVSLGQAVLANMLSVRLVLYVGNGVIEVVDKCRGWPSAVERMVELARHAAGDSRVMLAVVHTNAEAEARDLLERVKGRFRCVEAMVAEAGSALGTHAGAGALGIATLQVD